MTDWTPLVDISYAQGVVRFDVIKDAGIPGVIIRACNALKRDTRFDYNWKAARDAGLDVAVYGFSNPKAAAGPVDQGAFLAELAHEASAVWIMHDEEGYTLEAGPNPVLKGAAAAAWTASKLRRCQIDSSMTQVIYTGQPYWDSTFTPGILDRALGRVTDAWRADLEYLAQFDLILARYIAQQKGPPIYDGLPRGVPPSGWAAAVAKTGKTPAIPKGFDPARFVAHQFSAGGNGQGATYGCASTDLDLNIFLTAAYRRLFHPTGPVIPPASSTGDDDMLIRLLKIDGVAAQFLASCTSTGAALRCEWTGPADASGTTNPRIEWFRNAFRPPADQPGMTFEMGPFTADLLINISLDDVLPAGVHADQFANAESIIARMTQGTVDNVARKGVGDLNASVATLGQEIGDIKAAARQMGS